MVTLLGCLAGLTYDRSRDWDNPIALWSAAARLTPNSTLAHTSLGRHYFEIQRYEQSIAAYERALSLDPNRPLAQRGLG